MRIASASEGAVLIEHNSLDWPLNMHAFLHFQNMAKPDAQVANAPLQFKKTDEENSFIAMSWLPGGGNASVDLELKIRGDSAVDMVFSVKVDSGEADVAVALSMEIALPSDTTPGFYLPGIWVDGNPYTAKGAPSISEGDNWSFREDRMAWPTAISFFENEKYFVSLLRKTPAKFETLYPFTEGYRTTGAVLLDTDGCDTGSLGYSGWKGKRTLKARFPFEEAPFSYQDKRKLSPQVTGFYRVKKSRPFHISYRILTGPANNPYEAIKCTCREGSELWRVDDSYQGDRSITSIKESIARHASSHYFVSNGKRGVAGIHTLVETFGKKPVLPICEPAFTGKAFFHARNLIEHGQKSGDKQLEINGAAVFDSWISRAMKDELFPDFWCESLLGLPVNLPFTFDPPSVQIRKPSVSTRRIAEDALALLEVCELRPDKIKWKQVARNLLNTLCKWQLPGGGWARRYRPEDNSPLQTGNLGATPSVIAPLLSGHQKYQDQKYLDAAVRAGDFILEHMIAPVRFHGSTLDADCEDKEAASATLEAMRLLYEATGETRWLEGARKAAWMSIFWICLTDVPFAASTMFAHMKLRTRGLTLVSTENNHADIYLFSLPADLYWLAEHDDDDMLRNIAWETLLAALQIVPTKSHRIGPYFLSGEHVAIPEGLVPELLHQTMWVYLNKPFVKKTRHWIKGYPDHKTSMWTSASIWRALDEMKKVVPAKEWNKRFKP